MKVECPDIMRLIYIFIAFFAVSTSPGTALRASAQTVDTVHLGYFEGGDYAIHSLLRDEYHRQLNNLLPDSIAAVFVPEGFRSAEWDRNKCRTLAAELVRVKTVDIVIAMGPWVVGDLLNAGYQKPIIGMEMFNPYLEGLIDSTGRPIAENLTVQFKRDRPAIDLDLARNALTIDKLGLLFFPSGNEYDAVTAQFRSLGQQLGFDVVAAEGYNNKEAFAFYKAYAALDKQGVDLIYVGPLWGLDLTMIREFFYMTDRDRKPVMTWDMGFLVTRGASISNGGFSHIPDAVFNAQKTLRIINGDTPADLPVVFNGLSGLTVAEQLIANPRFTLPRESVSQAQVFPAPPPDQETVYDLSTSIARVISLNPGFLAQDDLLRSAAAAASATGSDYYPQLDLSASATVYDEDDSRNWQGIFDDDRYRATLQLRQTILSLQTLRSTRRARLEAAGAEIRKEQSRLDLELAVASACLDLLHATERQQVLTDYRNRLDRILELAHTREALLNGRVSDRFRWEQVRHEATAAMIASDAAVRQARVALNVLFNLPGDAAWNLDPAHTAIGQFWGDYEVVRSQTGTARAEQFLVDKLVQIALRENPLIDQIESDLTVEKSRLDENSTQLFPTIGFQARLNWADSINAATIVDEENVTWSLGAYLEMPLFDGFKRGRQRNALRSEFSALEYQRDHIRLEVMGRTRRGAHQLLGDMRQLPHLAAAAERSDNNLALVMERYEKDQNALVDMLDAYRSSLHAQLSLVDRRYETYLAMANTVHAMGLSSSERTSSFRELFLDAIR